MPGSWQEQRLLAAWQNWDRVAADPPFRPGVRWLKAEAYEMEDACKVVAGLSGVTTSVLRDRMPTARRAGLGYDAALRAAVGE